MKHTIEVIDFEKKGSHTWLIYKADGKTINVTGGIQGAENQQAGE